MTIYYIITGADTVRVFHIDANKVGVTMAYDKFLEFKKAGNAIGMYFVRKDK